SSSSYPCAPLNLAIALALLTAPAGSAGPLAELLVLGELGLNGEVRRVRGVLPAALLARWHGIRGVIVPESCAWEAALVGGLDVHPVAALAELVAVFRGQRPLRTWSGFHPRVATNLIDMSEIRGQDAVIDEIVTAIAKEQSILLEGPPDTGKTMIARRVPSVL